MGTGKLSSNLGNSQEKEEGDFAMHTSSRAGGGRISEGISCLTGNLVWTLIQFGYLDDPRLQRGVDWLARYMRFNDGTNVHPQVPPYDAQGFQARLAEVLLPFDVSNHAVDLLFLTLNDLPLISE